MHPRFQRSLAGWASILLLIGLGRSAVGQMPETSPKTIDYQMECQLLDEGKVVDGLMRATWRNQTEASTNELYWHVYNNAFSGRDSVWLKEAHQYQYSGGRLPREYSNTDIEAVVLVDAMSFAEIGVSPTPDSQDAGKMAVNPCTGIVYVVEWYGDNLMTWDPALDTWNTVDVGTAALWDVVVHPDGNTLYVLDRDNDQVHVFDVTGGALPAAVPDVSIGVGDDPWGIDITSDGSTLVVACEDDNTVHFIDTATAMSTGSLTLPDDADPRDVDIAVGDEFAYVPTGDVAGDDGVYLINIGMQTVDDTYTLAGANANALAVTPQASTCIP